MAHVLLGLGVLASGPQRATHLVHLGKRLPERPRAAEVLIEPISQLEDCSLPFLLSKDRKRTVLQLITRLLSQQQLFTN